MIEIVPTSYAQQNRFLDAMRNLDYEPIPRSVSSLDKDTDYDSCFFCMCVCVCWKSKCHSLSIDAKSFYTATISFDMCVLRMPTQTTNFSDRNGQGDFTCDYHFAGQIDTLSNRTHIAYITHLYHSTIHLLSDIFTIFPTRHALSLPARLGIRDVIERQVHNNLFQLFSFTDTRTQHASQHSSWYGISNKFPFAPE